MEVCSCCALSLSLPVNSLLSRSDVTLGTNSKKIGLIDAATPEDWQNSPMESSLILSNCSCDAGTGNGSSGLQQEHSTNPVLHTLEK
jgi:hypothetical protein